MPDYDNYAFDDNAFADGAGHNKITEAYSKVFAKIAEIAEEGKEMAICGSNKDISATVDKLSNRISGLIEITRLDKKIIGPGGRVYNAFGSETDEECEDESTALTEDQIVAKLEEIIAGVTNVTFEEAVTQADEKNIEDDGSSHGDLDDINW